MNWRRRALIIAALALSGLLTIGCAAVKPWERDLLARQDMAWQDDPHLTALRSHIKFSKEATLVGDSGGGGGCGCN
jgi:hypothetical protein